MVGFTGTSAGNHVSNIKYRGFLQIFPSKSRATPSGAWLARLVCTLGQFAKGLGSIGVGLQGQGYLWINSYQLDSSPLILSKVVF